MKTLQYTDEFKDLYLDTKHYSTINIMPYLLDYEVTLISLIHFKLSYRHQ